MGTAQNAFAGIFEDALNTKMNDEYIRGEFETFVKLGNEKKIFTSGKDIAIESDFSNI